MKSLLTICAAAALMMVTSTASAQTDPDAVAARCVNKVNQVVDRCQSATSDETTECLKTIRRLLAVGRERAARRVAKECIRSLTAQTEKCADLVNRICNACIEKLQRLGAPALARRVNNVCEEAIADLRTTLQREKAAIRNAF